MDKEFSGDRIILNDLGFYGYHGVMGEEKALGQRFFVDLICGIDLSVPAQSDHFPDTLSYAEIYDVVRTTFDEKSMHLIEAVAQRIVDAIFATFPAIRWIKIRVRKPEAPIAMVRGEAAIELHRHREN